MRKRRFKSARALGVGVISAALITLAGMLLIAAAVVFIGMSDSAIRVANQILKIVAVALGVLLGVGRGGERGLMTGAGIGSVYAVMGYILYICLGGGDFRVSELLGEMLVSAASGAAMGAVCANMNRRKAK